VRVALAYGVEGLEVEVPDDATVLVPRQLPGLADQAAAITQALVQPCAGFPLADLVQAPRSVVVVFPDLTRPMPNRTVLPPLLGQLERLGVAPENITLLCATGTHRQATPAEMEELVGPEIVSRYAIIDHQSDGPDHVSVGQVDGVDVRLLRHYVEADLRIITGFVEPHFFAGFSGGPKAVCPGLAATDTILEAHHPRRIAEPAATFVTRSGNPVHDFVRAAVALAPPHFSVDVAINAARQVTAVFAGAMTESHEAACGFVGESAVQQVAEPFDLVVSTNSGYPLDRNLYQAVKGMAAAERVVRPGGIIIMAAACRDGVPGEGAFARLLAGARTPADLVGADGGPELDRWQAQVMGRVLTKAQVWLYSEGISSDTARAAQLRPIDDVVTAIAEALDQLGPSARMVVLPEGPLTVATVAAVVAGP
jgi:nickel-dependent lactate racemase